MHEDVWHFVGHEVGAEELRLIREVVGHFGGLSRGELVHTVCELLEWKRPTGRLKGRECREFLERLEGAGVLTLPGKRTGRPVGSRTRVPMTARGDAQVGLAGTVRDIAPVVIERVEAADDRLLFRELVGRYHYLGHAVPFGAHLRYLVYASPPPRRVVACVQFSSPAWRMASRDAWIGWDDATRARHLPLVVNNSRFLILPWVRVRNLASTVLARVARQLEADWTVRYGARPVLLETLIDPARFDGASYRAANWIVVGETTGGGRREQARPRMARAPKLVLLYPLAKDAARRLRGR